VEVVPLAETHLGEVLAIEREAFCERDPWSLDAFRTEMDNPHSLWLAAVEGGEVAGYCGGWCVPPEFQLMNLAVAPRFRGKGTAKAMMGEILRGALKRVCTRAWLEVREENRVARRLYESLGFKYAGLRRGYYSNGENACHYVLESLDSLMRT